MKSSIDVGGVKIPAPKFAIGDWVLTTYWREDTQELLWSRGYVLGVQLKDAEWNIPDMWVYSIAECESYAEVGAQPNIRDQFAESDLHRSSKELSLSGAIELWMLFGMTFLERCRRVREMRFYPFLPLSSGTALLMSPQPITEGPGRKAA